MNNTTETKLFSGDRNGVGPGAFLKRARVKKEVSGEVIQKQLGLTGTLFSALEKDDVGRLPNPVYVRGYLKRYAELIGERPAPVLSSYQSLLEQHGLAEPPPQDEPVQRPYTVMVGSALGLLLATSLVFGAILSDTEALAELEGTSVTSQLAEDISSEDNSVENQAVDSNVSVAERLSLSFTTDSWVEVVDSRDHILAVSLQREGTRLDLEGEPPFSVTLGYGPGVTVSYLGESVAFEHDPDTFASELTVGK